MNDNYTENEGPEMYQLLWDVGINCLVTDNIEKLFKFNDSLTN